MQKIHRVMLAGLLVLGTIMTLSVMAAEDDAAPETFLEALAAGQPSVDVRLRYEHADASGLDAGHALTVRTRLGYATAPYHGLHAFVEFEDVRALLADSEYNQAGLNPEGAGKAVIADVEGTELNQAYLEASCPEGNLTLRVGRQRMILDNARFIGNVGWRQNEQTYDAVRLDTAEFFGLKLTYAYLDAVRRIFGQERGAEPVGEAGNAARYESDSHLVNLAFTPCDHFTGRAYAYLLDLGHGTTGQANSSDTYGISGTIGHTFENDVTAGCELEYARQSDNGGTTDGVNYDADYIKLEASAGLKAIGLGVGYELLGSDEGSAFRTPLATGHKFNGWADVFLTTPGEGLQDLYAYVTLKCPRDIMPTIRIVYHDFESDEGDIAYGDEIDVVATKKFNDRVTMIAKYANYQADDSADNPRAADVERISIQAGLTF
ncbi:MAG: alginate export family protein [Verrucomicrobia bacterium]|jgi:hypothetical protein|nr:alginate export family protein [Verrucomicrobiota bacterium]MBT7068615.1 alginate export family protein [Verrucomicrobiota bacterium]MBT7701784.1 alginate export family protein [Verrucomicrobiota bacterium]